MTRTSRKRHYEELPEKLAACDEERRQLIADIKPEFETSSSEGQYDQWADLVRDHMKEHNHDPDQPPSRDLMLIMVAKLDKYIEVIGPDKETPSRSSAEAAAYYIKQFLNFKYVEVDWERRLRDVSAVFDTMVKAKLLTAAKQHENCRGESMGRDNSNRNKATDTLHQLQSIKRANTPDVLVLRDIDESTDRELARERKRRNVISDFRPYHARRDR